MTKQRNKNNLIVYCFNKKTKKTNFRICGASYNDYLYYKKIFGTESTSVVYKKW